MNNVMNVIFLLLGMKKIESEEPKKRNAKSFSKAVKQTMRDDVNELIERMK
jgi:hypothetical protein